MVPRTLAALLLVLAPSCGSVLHTIAPPPIVATGPEDRVVPARARYHYLRGRIAMGETDWELAESELRTALLHDARSPWIWLALAEVSEGEGDADEARERVREALRLGPDLPEAWARMGQADLRAGDLGAGLTALRAAVDRGAGDGTWALLCQTAVHHGDADAEGLLGRWAARPLGDPELIRLRGRLRLQTGDLAGAVDDLGEALPRFPADARLLDEYLIAVTGSGLYRRGLARLDVVHRVAPDNTDVLLRSYHLAMSVHDTVRALDALRALDRALEGSDAHVKLWLADAWSARASHTAALEALSAAGACNPPLGDLPYHRARLLRAAGRHADAFAALKVPTEGANRGEALALRARLLIELHRPADALREVEQALVQLPEDYALLGALVAACAEGGDRAGMLAAIDRMAMLNDEARARTRARSLAAIGDVEGALLALGATPLAEADTWIAGATLLRDAGRADEAVPWMQRAVDRLPRDAAVRAELGVALDAAGSPREALVSMREALRIDPGERHAARYYAHAVVTDGVGAERLNQVRGWLLAALERSPADADMLDALGQVELGLSSPLRAAEAWEEALRYAPEQPGVRRRLADVYRSVGRVDQAAAVEGRRR